MNHRGDYGLDAANVTSNNGRYPVPEPQVELVLLQPLLDQRLPVCHELLLIALNDRTGGLRLNPDALGLGLAGALLGELVLAQYLTLNGGRLVLLRRDLPTDAVLSMCFVRLLSEPDVDVSTWLRFFAADAIDETARQLESLGWLRIVRRRSLGVRSTLVYRPNDSGDVAWRPIRAASVLVGLEQHLRAQRPTPWHEVLLCGLLDAVGLLDEVLWNSPTAECRQVLRWCLTYHDPLRALLGEVAGAHADVVRARIT